MDAAAVSASLGAAGAHRRTLLLAATSFGAAQAGLALVGAAGGLWLASGWSQVAPWVAVGLLTLVGGRMIWGVDEDLEQAANPSLLVLAGLALATSLDALAAGVSLPLLAEGVGPAVVSIGLVTLLLSGLAGAAGRRAGSILGPWALRGAGVVLLAIGARVLMVQLSS